MAPVKNYSGSPLQLAAQPQTALSHTRFNSVQASDSLNRAWVVEGSPLTPFLPISKLTVWEASELLVKVLFSQGPFLFHISQKEKLYSSIEEFQVSKASGEEFGELKNLES